MAAQFDSVQEAYVPGLERPVAADSAATAKLPKWAGDVLAAVRATANDMQSVSEKASASALVTETEVFVKQRLAVWAAALASFRKEAAGDEAMIQALVKRLDDHELMQIRIAWEQTCDNYVKEQKQKGLSTDIRCCNEHKMKLIQLRDGTGQLGLPYATTDHAFMCNSCCRLSHPSIAPYWHCEDRACNFDLCLPCGLYYKGSAQKPANAAVRQSKIECANGKSALVLSDLHLGSKWFNSRCYAALQSFSQYFVSEVKAQTISHLILLGDIYESWSLPAHEGHSPTEIVNAIRTRTEVRAFRDMIQRAKVEAAQSRTPLQVVYIQGNHDDRFTEPHLRTLLGHIDAYYPAEEKVWYGLKPGSWVRLEHGHRHDMFNSFEPILKWQRDRTAAGLPITRAQLHPIGYYLTRLDFDTGADSAVPAWLSGFADTVMRFLPVEQLLDAVMNLVANNIGNFRARSVCLKEDNDAQGVAVPMTDVWKELREVYLHYYAAQQRTQLALEILVSINNITKLRTFCYGAEECAVVFGHSHDPVLCESISLAGARSSPLLYANSGSWAIDGHNRFTFMRLIGGRAQVQLCEWEAVSPDTHYLPAGTAIADVKAIASTRVDTKEPQPIAAAAAAAGPAAAADANAVVAGVGAVASAGAKALSYREVLRMSRDLPLIPNRRAVQGPELDGGPTRPSLTPDYRLDPLPEPAYRPVRGTVWPLPGLDDATPIATPAPREGRTWQGIVAVSVVAVVAIASRWWRGRN